MSDAATDIKADSDGRIVCHIDAARVHSIAMHIKEHHPDWTIERYKEEFPGMPLLSPKAAELARQRRLAKQKLEEARAERGPEVTVGAMRAVKKAFHEVFELGLSSQTMSAAGNPIMVDVMESLEEEDQILVPDIDTNYVFNIDLTKIGIMAMQMNWPALFWGYHGTGKTTAFEQICARTGRPFMRVQHTVNTEEAHIVGQYVVRDGATVFQPGPLTTAMLRGHAYCADEYDFAMPSVLSVYQPVLEGKALVIKDAPPELRVIQPHPQFRFLATGNTNGGGDETGLYQGTQIQNAANYSRFAIVENVKYMDPKLEVAIVAGQSSCDRKDAERIVDFAQEVRKSFANGRLSSTISPRELIRIAQIGLVRGGNWRDGLRLGYINRLSTTDAETVNQFAQRLFG